MAQKQSQKQQAAQDLKQAAQRQVVVRKRLLEVGKNIDMNYVEMAQLLSEAYHKEYWKEAWGFGSFFKDDGYCERELEIDERKARYLIDIWDVIKACELPMEKVIKLGWSKMKDLAAVITKKNAAKLLAEAEKMSSRELTERVKVMRKKGGSNLPDAPVVQKMTFTFGESEHQIINEALNEASKLCNSENKALALEMICQEWLSEKGAKPELTHLEDHISYLEAVYPVKISFKKVDKPKEKVAEKAAGKKGKAAGKKTKAPDEDNLPDDDGGAADIDDLLGSKK